MTTDEIATTPSGSALEKGWKFVDAELSRIGDHLNPILVKETRQALKSRQFTASFWLVLLFAICWSFVGISLLMPRVYYMPSGRFMITGYFIIFCIPLLLVVPFSAFRSLAIEGEEGTYELLSITSLSARQIVTGKLGSSLMQMLVYYAALAPCIAFTYLLRGLDIGSILILLVGTFLVSVIFSCIGLVFAGMNRSRQWQALTSVILLLLLIIGGIYWTVFMLMLVHQGQAAIDSIDFWYGVAMTLTIYASFLALLILIAAAQNSFASDNRSTKIRVVMLGQLALFAGWMVFMWVRHEAKETAPIALTFAGMAWTFYGALLTGEVAELSPRARRDLPQTFFGQAFLTWFNPGSATGYVFTLVTFAAFVALILGINTYAVANQPAMSFQLNKLTPFGLLIWSYMAFYLGLGRLIILGLRKVSAFGLTAVLMIHALVLTAAAALPTFLQFWLQSFRGADYSNLQTLNWMWSLAEAMGGSWLMWPVVYIAGSAGLAMFLLNLVLAAREVEATRLETPTRVLQDEDALHEEAVVEDSPTHHGSTLDTTSQHSQFANYVLPRQFLNDAPSVVIPLISPDKVTPGGRNLLVHLWDAAREFSTDNGGVSCDQLDYRMEVLGHPNSTAVMIEMPKPLHKGEARFAAIIFDGPGLAVGKPRQLRYFTLEEHGDNIGTKIVEWLQKSEGELESMEHSRGTAADIATFSQKLQEIVEVGK